MRGSLHVVAGAPGSGKSTVCAALSRLAAPTVVLDMDDLLDDDGSLLGLPIASPDGAELWHDYNELWARLLRAVGRSGSPIVLFTPALPDEIVLDAVWARLDCRDDERAGRLLLRGWSAEDIREIQPFVERARELLPRCFDTTSTPPDAVAAEILAWTRNGPVPEHGAATSLR